MTEFKKFRVGDLFEVIGGNVFKTDYHGKVDVIKAQSSNNGIASTIEGHANLLNGITIGMRGSFNAFVHVKPFIIGDNVAGFWFKGDSSLSINSMLYIATCLNKIYKGFSGYENYPTFYKLTNDLIDLPVTADGSPDWQEMESVVDTVEQQHVDTVDKTLSAAGFSSFEDTLLTSEEESLLKEWLVAQTNLERSTSASTSSALRLKLFKISELFEVQTGSLIDSNLLVKGDLPRVSVKTSDNGVIGYYSHNGQLTLANHFISVNFMGDCYWHEEESSVEMKVHILKNQNLNTDSGLYITTVLNKLFHNKYSYGNQLSSGMLKNESYEILLPAGEDGNPDFEVISKLGYIFKKLSIRDLRQSLDKQLSKYQSLKNL